MILFVEIVCLKFLSLIKTKSEFTRINFLDFILCIIIVLYSRILIYHKYCIQISLFEQSHRRIAETVAERDKSKKKGLHSSLDGSAKMKTIRGSERLVEARGIEINGRSASFRDMFKWAGMESESSTDHSSFPVRVLLPVFCGEKTCILLATICPSGYHESAFFQTFVVATYIREESY